MKVLLITFSFPPAGGVGVLRALSLAKYLPGNGIDVDVLTARNAPSVGRDMELLRQVPKKVHVHRSWTIDLPFALRKSIKRMVSGNSSKGAAPAAAGRTSTLKRLVGNLMLPDPQIGWLPFAFPAARRIVQSRGIDLVLITVPPFSTLRLATMLRRVLPELPIIIDFRDEWLTTTINLVSFNNNARARAIAVRVEAEAVRHATCVVSVTEAGRAELMNRYPNEAKGKFQCVPNGFETRQLSTLSRAQIGRTDKTVVLTYIGSVYGSTDPSSFVEAILALPAEVRQRLRLRFIGHVETPALRASLERLGETIELKGFLPQAEALAAIDETDYLLLITHDRINVSAKFYDYLSGAKPILAAVHPAGEVRRLLDETQAGHWADINAPNEITQLLMSVLTASSDLPTYEPNRERVQRYHREVLAKRYAELLKELLSAAT